MSTITELIGNHTRAELDAMAEELDLSPSAYPNKSSLAEAILEQQDETREARHEPQLIFCIAAYNEEELLPKCLESIKPYADRIVVVEGRFLGGPGTTPFSTDNTRLIAEEYGCEVIPSHDLIQHEQRDLYLVGKPGDFYFYIDADEVLEGIFPKREILSGPYNVYAVWIKSPITYDQITLRVYRHIGERPRHNIGQLLIDGDGRLMDASYPNGTKAETFWIKHLKTLET